MKVEDCPVEDKKGRIVEVIIKPYNLQHYVSMTVEVLDDFKVGKVCSLFYYSYLTDNLWNIIFLGKGKKLKL